MYMIHMIIRLQHFILLSFQYWRHFMEVHGKSVEFKYTCQYCNEVFPLKEMFDYHIKSKHERSVSYFCMHRVIHINETKSKNIHQIRRSDLISNIFQHTCGYCGNRFPERRTLVKHERCHTGEKPYACDSCDFRCSSSSSLCQHKRRRHDPTESGRKHICEQCGKGFYTRDNLKVDTLEIISMDGLLFNVYYWCITR